MLYYKYIVTSVQRMVKQLFHFRKVPLFFRVFIVIFVFVPCAFLLSQYVMHGSCQKLSCLQLHQTAVLKLTEVYEEVRGSVYRARYQTGDTIVRVDVRSDVDPDASADYIKGRIAGMKALYDNIRSPYPGLLSNEIVCDDGFKPVYTTFKNAQGIEMQMITGYLNDRLAFGSCQQDQAIYRGVMVLFSCPQRKQLYQVEFIMRNESFDQSYMESMARSLGCH